MAQIAFFGSVYRGHHIAPKQLIDKLTNQGHVITYFAPQKYQDIVTKMNVNFVSYPEIPGGTLNYLINAQLPTFGDVNTRLKFLTETTVNAAVDLVIWAETQLGSKEKFDLVLYDNMAIWGYVAAQNLDLPNACSITIMATNTNIMKELADGAIYLGLSPEVSESLDLLQNKGTRIESFTDIMTCEYNKNKILYTSKHFQNHPDYFPIEDYIFFPSRCTNEILQTKSIADILTVFVSFGTIYNSDIQLFKDIIDNVANNNYNVIISAGGNNATFSTLSAYNTNPKVAIEMFVNQEQILKNTDIFITHAGLNSASESICNYVPMITIPLVGDQHSVANSLQQLNAGYTIPRKEVKSHITDAINHIVDNWGEYQLSLSTIRSSFEDAQVIQSSLDRIVELVNDKLLVHEEL